MRHYGVGNARPTHSEVTAALAQLNVSISEISDQKEFKKKYLALVRQHHPDRGGNEETMKNLTTAFNLLTCLTDGERKEYFQRTQHATSSATSRATRQARPAPNQQRTGHSSYDFQDMYRRQYEDGFQYGSSGRTTHQTYRGQQQDNNDQWNKFWRGGPYSGTTGSFNRSYHQMQRMPPSVVFFRLIIAYGIFVIIFVMAQRMRDDMNNEQGWNVAQQHGRADRMQQIFDSRSEFLERLKNRDMLKNMEMEREKERRVFDYAARRQSELSRMEFSSFPPLPSDGRLGSVFKVPADPVGILYFEPRMTGTFEAHMRNDAAAGDDNKPRHQRETELVQRSAPPFRPSQQQPPQQQQQQPFGQHPIFSQSSSNNQNNNNNSGSQQQQQQQQMSTRVPVFVQQSGAGQEQVYDHRTDSFVTVDRQQFYQRQQAEMARPIPAAEQQLNPELAAATQRNKDAYRAALVERQMREQVAQTLQKIPAPSSAASSSYAGEHSPSQSKHY